MLLDVALPSQTLSPVQDYSNNSVGQQLISLHKEIYKKEPPNSFGKFDTVAIIPQTETGQRSLENEDTVLRYLQLDPRTAQTQSQLIHPDRLKLIYQPSRGENSAGAVIYNKNNDTRVLEVFSLNGPDPLAIIRHISSETGPVLVRHDKGGYGENIGGYLIDTTGKKNTPLITIDA